MNNKSIIVPTAIILITGTVLTLILFLSAIAFRHYNVWSMEMQGKAKLAEATQSRQIQIEQAKAELEASKMRAQAIQIMGEAAQKYPEYRQQEFMASFGEALREGKMSQIIYVPTEANIPLMEAGKRN